MNRETISKLVDELRSCAVGHEVIRIISSGTNEVVVHLRDAEPPFVLISCDPRFHRILPIKRKTKDLERSGTQSQFSLHLNRDLNGMRFSDVRMIEDERIVILGFSSTESPGSKYSIIAQLTGRSSNIFLLDTEEKIVSRMRETSGEGQEPGSMYSPPSAPSEPRREDASEEFEVLSGETFAEAVDRHYEKAIAEQRLMSAVNAERAKLKSDLKKIERLIDSLNSDLESHGDPESWKRFGDLLLAQSTTARREDDEIIVVDYFNPDTPAIRIPGDRNNQITKIAEDYFKKYVKARNARERLEERISAARIESEAVRKKMEDLERSVAEGTFVTDRNPAERQHSPRKESGKNNKTRSPFRRFISSDGLEILVGKGSRDNDELTFKVAKSLDVWLHAADYPGSHVIIRGAGKKEIPQRTLIEAAKLAAFYSDAKEHPKAAVHHTQRKFVSKIKGAAPGMVRLSSFKTVMVEPEVPTDLSRD